MGDEVVAVTVCYDDPEAHADDTKLREAVGRNGTQACRWSPCTVISARSASRLVEYLNGLEQQATHDQLIVLIPEVQSAKPWRRVLHNQRGFVLEQAITHGTRNVVICRLHYRLAAVAAAAEPPDEPVRAGAPADVRLAARKASGSGWNR